MLGLGHCGDTQIDVEREVAVGCLWEVERNLYGLMMGVPPLRRQVVLLHLQRHTMRVPESLNYLLRQVAHVVVFYLEYNLVQED
jgi:hypothetical protein